MTYKHWSDFVGSSLVGKKIHREYATKPGNVVAWGSTFRAIEMVMESEGYINDNGGDGHAQSERAC